MAFAPVFNSWLPGGARFLSNGAPAGSSTFNARAKFVATGPYLQIVLPYWTNWQGSTAVQAETFSSTTLDGFGNLVSGPTPLTAINQTGPTNSPEYLAQQGIATFTSTVASSLYLTPLVFWDSYNADGTYNVSYSVDQGFGSTLSSPVTAFSELTFPNAPAGEPAGNYGHIYSSSLGTGSILLAADTLIGGLDTILETIVDGPTNTHTTPITLLSFADAGPHVWTLGRNPLASNYELLTATGGVISEYTVSSSGVLTAGVTFNTGLTSILQMGWSGIAGSSTTELLTVEGFNGVQHSTTNWMANLTNGQLLTSLTQTYAGAVTQQARVLGIASGFGFLEYWVDGSGLTLEVLNSANQVVASKTIAGVNGTADAASLGDGRIFVTYRISSGNTANAGATAASYYDIFDTRSAPITPGTQIEVNGQVAGTVFDDTIGHTATAGQIDGGAGTDTYMMTGFSSAQVSLSHSSAGAPSGSVTLSSSDGQDVLNYVEWLQLSDARIWVGAAADNPEINHDFNGDGKSDLLLQNTSGDLYDWTMNGAQVT